MRTKITEKNMYAVMGNINKFLSKPTKRDLGKKMVATGINIFDVNGIPMTSTRYEEVEHYFEAFVGNCHEHWIRKENRNKKDLTRHDEYQLHNVLLAISSDYELSCIPILAGFYVEITGETMKIWENDVTNTNYIGSEKRVFPNKEKTSVLVFKHMDISETDKRELIKDAIYHAFEISDEDYMFAELFEEYGSYLGGAMHSAGSDIAHNVCGIIDDINISESKVKETFTIDEKDAEITVEIDIDSNRNHVEPNSITFYFNGEEFKDTLSLIYKIFKEDIEEHYSYDDDAEDY